jgi:hypothetical protein
MKEEEVVRNEILKTIKDLPNEERDKVMELANRMREMAWNNGSAGLLALALVGAEAAMTG